MHSNVTTGAPPSAGGLHGCLLAAGGAGPAPGAVHAFAFATLVSWLLTEALGGYMLGRWIAAGGLRQRPGTPGRVSLPVIFGHAGLAFAGFVAWVSFLITGSGPLAWLAVGLLAPAIGLGISAVTVWTPFPARPAGAGPEPPADPRGDGHGMPAGQAPGDDGQAGTGPEAGDPLARALSDEALSARLVDDLLTRMLTVAPSALPRPKWHLTALIPAAHGVLALITVLLAMLAAVAAR